MPDFGNAGKRTVRKHVGAVQVKLSAGEHLAFKTTVEGAEAVFTFACEHKARRSADEFPGHPKQVYEWTWGKAANDSDASDDEYGVRMSFVSATKYTLLVEHRKNDTVLAALKDIDYESQDPTDKFTETLRIFSA
jgi:hypothetical protein